MKQFLQSITKKAGQIIHSKYGKTGVKYTKLNAADVVTEADLASNGFLISSIKKKYPSHGIISEETGEYQTDAEYVWYLDPLDGTRNYSTHTPMFCVLVGLACKGEMLLGAAFDPLHKEFFFAEKGRGAFLNGKKIRCSSKTDINESWGCSSARVSQQTAKLQEDFRENLPKASIWVSSLACTGIALSYVAAGRRDWFFSFSGGLWDYAASGLIAQEAGCIVTDRNGNPWHPQTKNGMLAANPVLHKKLLRNFL